MTQTHRNAISGKASLKTRRETLLLRAFAMPRIADCETLTSFTPPQYNHIVFPCTAAQSAHKNHPKTAVDTLTALKEYKFGALKLYKSICANVCLRSKKIFALSSPKGLRRKQGFALRHKYAKTVVDGLPASNKHPKTTVAAFPAFNKYSKTAVDGLPVLNRQLETTVDALPVLNKRLETTVDALSALKECQKTAVDALSSLKECQKTTVDALSALKEYQKTVIDGILSPGGHIRHGCLRNLLNDRAVFEHVENTAKYIITQKIKRRISV